MAWSRSVEAENKLKETGLIIKSPAGFPQISPYVSIAVRAGEEIRKWAQELGLTPAARAKLKTPPKEPAATLPSRARRGGPSTIKMEQSG
jgi:P27 family predicted phage terminase small subunit